MASKKQKTFDEAQMEKALSNLDGLKIHYLFIGNPGVGKSTFLTALIGEAGKFKSGLSLGGEGVTKFLQLFEKHHIVYMDTPGLDDNESKKEAGAEISKALKRDGLFRIFFVCYCQAGRIQPSDKATIEIVTTACKEVPNFLFSVIFNKVSKPMMDRVASVPEQRQQFLSNFNLNLPVASTSVFFMPKQNDIDDQDDKLMVVPDELLSFIEQAPAVKVKATQVAELEVDKLEKMKAAFEEESQRLKNDLEFQKQVLEQMKVKLSDADEKLKINNEEMTKLRLEMQEERKLNTAQLAAEQEKLALHLKHMEDKEKRLMEQMEKEKEHAKEMAELHNAKAAEIAELQLQQAQEQTKSAKELAKLQNDNSQSLAKLQMEQAQKDKEHAIDMAKLNADAALAHRNVEMAQERNRQLQAKLDESSSDGCVIS